MNAIWQDVTAQTHPELLVIFARLVAAAFFGGLIGYELDIKHHSAGLRTHILVSLASALFVIASIQEPYRITGVDQVLRVDPTRVIQAVTAGVAFLAAGAVFLNRGTVKGLTTGAGLWLSSAIGLTFGLGLWSIGAFAAVLGLIILLVVQKFEQRHGLHHPRDTEPDDNPHN